MKKTYNTLTCLFGHHQYGDKLTVKDGCTMYLCEICGRRGHYKYLSSFEVLYDYNEKGTLIHKKWSNGEEWWKGNNGHWVGEKPENWKYEKCITN